MYKRRLGRSFATWGENERIGRWTRQDVNMKLLEMKKTDEKEQMTRDLQGAMPAP